MKTLKNIIAITLTCVSLFWTGASEAESYKRLVQIIVDDTGALQDELDPGSYGTARDVFSSFLASLSSRYGRETLVIVTSQYGARNVWSGEARMIRRASQNAGLQNFISQPWGGCSDLVRVFRLLEDNIYLYPAQEYEVIFFSSLIHTGDPCQQVNFSAEMELPEEFLTKLKDFHARYNPTLGFYWVFDNGRSKIREQLVQFSRKNGVNYILKVESETRTERF